MIVSRSQDAQNEVYFIFSLKNGPAMHLIGRQQYTSPYAPRALKPKQSAIVLYKKERLIAAPPLVDKHKNCKYNNVYKADMRRLVNTLQARECRQRRRDGASERASSLENTGFPTERGRLFFKQPVFEFV